MFSMSLAFFNREEKKVRLTCSESTIKTLQKRCEINSKLSIKLIVSFSSVSIVYEGSSLLRKSNDVMRHSSAIMKIGTREKNVFCF